MTLLLLRPLVVVVEEEAPGLDRPDTESLPAEDRGCAVASCSDTLCGLISQFSLSLSTYRNNEGWLTRVEGTVNARSRKEEPKYPFVVHDGSYARKKEDEKKRNESCPKKKKVLHPTFELIGIAPSSNPFWA